MARQYPRSRRVAEQLLRELPELVRNELKDPRVSGLVTFTDAELTTDLEHAKVFYTVLGSSEVVEETAAGLQRAAGFLRSALARRMKLRTVPTLEFVYDASVERGARLARLIEDAVAPRDDDKPS